MTEVDNPGAATHHAKGRETNARRLRRHCANAPHAIFDRFNDGLRGRRHCFRRPARSSQPFGSPARFRHGLFAIDSARLHRGFGDRPPPATAKTSGFLNNAVTPR
jgi:hypothetical protein